MKKKWLAPMVVAFVLACGSTAPAVDVTGLWDWTATFTSTELSITCATSGGTILLSQSQDGGRVTGVRSSPVVITCQGGPDTLEDRLELPQNVLNAEVSGNAITMEIDFCDYEGTVTLGTASGDVMSGTIECAGGLAGESGFFTGTWEASR